jgi:acetyltransferase-like isoleucine patch superfamily enzyme
MISRIYWLLFRRFFLQLSLPYFFVSIKSQVSRSSKFEGYNSIFGRCVIVNSSFGLFSYVSDSKINHASIGRFCCIAPEVIIGGGRHPSGWLSTHPVFFSTRNQSGRSFVKQSYYEEIQPVTIGNDVWIGTRSIILDGITVGDGAIIAAGSVVVSDVEPYSIVGGVPAKIIRKRYDDDTIEKIKSLNWWDWPVEVLESSSELFRCETVSLEQLKNIAFQNKC